MGFENVIYLHTSLLLISVLQLVSAKPKWQWRKVDSEIGKVECLLGIGRWTLCDQGVPNLWRLLLNAKATAYQSRSQGKSFAIFNFRLFKKIPILSPSISFQVAICIWKMKGVLFHYNDLHLHTCSMHEVTLCNPYTCYKWWYLWQYNHFILCDLNGKVLAASTIYDQRMIPVWNTESTFSVVIEDNIWLHHLRKTSWSFTNCSIWHATGVLWVPCKSLCEQNSAITRRFVMYNPNLYHGLAVTFMHEQ